MRRILISAIFAATFAAVWFIASPLMAKNFIWQVSTPKGGQAYIMGSIHLAHNGLYPLRDPIMEAFAASSALAVEIDPEALAPEAMTSFIMKHGMSADKRPLPERLTAETRALLEKSGHYSPIMAMMTPWLAALAIQVEELSTHGFESKYGLDQYFADKARARGIPIVSLETLDDQMSMLINMNDYEADLFLKSTLLEMNDLPKTIQAFLDTWNRGDVSGFAQVFFQEYDKYPDLMPLLDKIIFRRNERMAAKINGLLQEKKTVYFIVVGAGHLVGDRSILAHLAAKGCTITQL
jgi:Uncharacterized protein conserved in bacteria